MNDLCWIKYEPQRMFCDTADMSADGERAHRRLMDWLWFKDTPPPADDEALRQISHTEPGKWGRTKAELLSHGWTVIGNWLLHRGAIASLNEAKLTHLDNYNRTAPGRKAPLRTASTDPETGIVRIEDVTECVTYPVTPPVTDHVTGGTGTVTGTVTVQREGKGNARAPESSEVPDLKQAAEMVMADGIPPDFIALAHADWIDNNGCNAKAIPKPWPAYVRTRWRYEQVEWRSGKHRGNKNRHDKNPNSLKPRGVPDRNKGTL